MQSTHPFEFHGKTGEFFKIWIVNIMLSIVTLGIYSAWAKVRTKRYFYSNTLLLETSFDYLAEPIKILKGRLLAFGLILLYSLSPMVSPELEVALIIAFIPLLPWVIIKALKFNLFYSAYRNIRFHFHGEYLRALWVFIGMPVMVAFTAGLAYPYFARERKQFVIGNSAYGSSQFAMNASTGQFYSVYMRTSGVIILILLLAAGMFYALQLLLSFNADSVSMIIPAILALLFYPLLMVAYGYLYTTLSNLVINHTELQQCQFESNLETGKMCWLYFSNTVAIIFSLGLLIPWAMIRTARYRISCLSLIITGSPDDFLAAEAEKASAIGEELGDLLDIDIGL
jgi:uncharacterized membrane protein YjgN (DUF898 family)